MKKILIIEDDEFESRLYNNLFTTSGFDVFSLRSGVNCRDAARYFQPDIILLDLLMPDVNGFEALDVLRFSTETNHIPVIMLTNISDTDKEKEAYRHGASLFITKSNIENAELVRQVCGLLPQE